ncbi:hypothetical protein QTJ16_004404 [Diplocarpon rosae]|uniref:Uncharacterized protein n=1 Tax=Diplocarpon rosae TaxID=946125 RepID=A0AAD9SZ21_9HELO|nr:hypothetical protein QTJ16_004404 [Diplocarpon rosae]
MAISDAVQTLSAAFSFGTLLQAATGALFIFYEVYGSTFFRDGRRLVLIVFLFSSALWAQVEFLNLLLADLLFAKTRATACQVIVLTSTLFDQLARVAIEQFLLWSVGNGMKLTAERLILQGILFLRMIGGGILVGFTRPHPGPLCAARRAVAPITIVILALDGLIIGMLLVRAILLRRFGDLAQKSSSMKQEQSKALIFIVVGFGIWTGTSVPMILGSPMTILIIRTVLPSNGLLILIGVVTKFAGPLLLAREESVTTPEASSPFITIMPPPRDLFAENVPSSGSPVSNHNYTKSGSLFVVNPSATPHHSPTVFQRGSRGDTKGFTKLESETNVREMDASEESQVLDVRGPGYRGSSGVFPAVLQARHQEQASLPPQIRLNVPVSTPALEKAAPASVVAQKRSIFNRSKALAPGKQSIRTLGISQPVPIPTDGATPQMLAKLQTVDLATAANMDRERRKEASARSRLVAHSPAPQPSQISTQEALTQSVSIKRKETPIVALEPMLDVPVLSDVGLSLVATDGTTSSASLSPGREESRRRSPKPADSFDQTYDQNGSESTLQGNSTVGLPSNSRSTRTIMAQEAAMARPPTVTLMNDIVYDNSQMLESNMREAPAIYTSTQKMRTVDISAFSVTTTPLNSSSSIIHRPRGYKREKHDSDRIKFPGESPGHRRSKSGSSILRRKPKFMSQPGSPTQLPPLPPPPIMTAAILRRLLPTDTKSMTFDEKIEFLFPAPPELVTGHRRSSSVPSIPCLPSSFMSESPTVHSPTEEDERSYASSERTAIASLAAPEIPPKSIKRLSVLSSRPHTGAYRPRTDSYQNSADGVGEKWMPGINCQDLDVRDGLVKTPQRPSVWKDLQHSHSSEDTSDVESWIDDVTTSWESAHSGTPSVDLLRLRQSDNTLFVQRPEGEQHRDSIQDLSPLLQSDLREDEAIVPMILYSEDARRSILLRANDIGPPFVSVADEALTSTNPKILWYRRIGDTLPTFSERPVPVRRKMPPPAPLLLSRTGRKATVVMRNAEPSPPPDTPGKAIIAIQEQLKRLENQASRESVGSLLRRIPGIGGENVPDTGRLRLLENLEKEVVQQETQWHRMQTNLNRDSMPVAMSPHTHAESPEVIRDLPERFTPNLPTIFQRDRVRSSMAFRLESDGSNRTALTQSFDNSRASMWQRRLVEAQMKYLENAPALLRRKSLNFLSATKVQAPVTSPTPPDSIRSETELETGLGSDSDTEAMKQYQTPQNSRKEEATLWQLHSVSPKAALGNLWNPPFETAMAPSLAAEAPARDLRPSQRRAEHALPIFSAELWTKRISPEHSRPVVGLWGSKLVRPRSIKTRPLTQRPQRKFRRISCLPDIVESPIPVPNRRKSLGIFQFPWGETSDQPVYEPNFNFNLSVVPVLPVLSTNLNAHFKQLEPVRSPSVLDDYEYEDEDLDGIENDDELDEFDESTLFEIASLLHSSDVPSKASLLPSPRKQVINDNDDDLEPESPVEAATLTASHLSIQPLAFAARDTAELWDNDYSPFS